MIENEQWFSLALKYLQSRPHSEYEVRAYLLRKKAPESIIVKIIAFLKEKKFLSDLSFAEWWIRQRTEFKQKGISFITFELQGKGVSKDIIQEAFVQVGNSDDYLSEVEKAKIILQKKQQKFMNLDKQKRYEKAGAFLARRGFSMDTIRKSIDETFTT